MAAGIFSLANIAVGAMAAVITGPLGSHFPDAGNVDLPWLRQAPGYRFSVSDAGGSLLGEIRSQDPLHVDLDVLPPNFINAVIAAEDTRFFEHEGVDPVGLIGAAFDTMRGNLRGGSGIAQQMVKNTVVGSDRTLSRKMIEAVIATRLYKALGPREIFRSYLESAWFGRGEHGVMRAPEAWFGKPWKKISLAEAATLAAMLKGPGYYDPFRFPQRTEDRRNLVLDRMLEQGWITKDDHAAAVKEKLRVIPPATDLQISPAIRGMITDEIAQKDLPRGGELMLSIDPAWQEIVERILQKDMRAGFKAQEPRKLDAENLDRIQADKKLSQGDLLPLPPGSPYVTAALLSAEKDGWRIATFSGVHAGLKIEDPHSGWKPAVGDLVALKWTGEKTAEAVLPLEAEASIVLIDPQNGEILAATGAVDEGLTEFDRTHALRQPGSSFKPFLYLAALDHGFGPETPVDDLVHTYRTGSGSSWTPKNYDGSQSGLLPMYAALERSSNLAAAWIADRIGPETMARTAEAAGAYPKDGVRRILPSALGASETTLLRMVSGYGAILSGGQPHFPHTVRAVLTDDGKILDLNKGDPVSPVIASPGAIDALLSMMRGVVTRGTAADAFARSPVAIVGKTGTSQDYRDAWFIGGSPQLAIGVWIGRDDNKTLPGNGAGGRTAAPIVEHILETALNAGLIDKNGLRDPLRNVPATWPARAYDRTMTYEKITPGIETPAVEALRTEESLVRPQKPKSPSAHTGSLRSGTPRKSANLDGTDMISDPFWGISETQQGAPRQPYEAEDRNADLLNGL